MNRGRSTTAISQLIIGLIMGALLAASFAPAHAQERGQPQNQSSSNATKPDDRDALLERIEALEKRLKDLESSAVLSEPETRVKKKEVYVDQNGVEHDAPVPGAKKQITYERERVYRRQTISEKIADALSEESKKSVALGLNAASVTQGVFQTDGPKSDADGKAYELASVDLTFAAQLAQNTTLFADVVGLSGSPPDRQVGGLTLLNSYTARLVRQNELNLRESWIRTELFGQRLAVSLGRLDLTNYFDRNAFANDETSQFLSDGLTNNPLLGLASNGAGLVAVYDPKSAFTFRVGVQQSNPDAFNLSESIYSLAEVGYRARPSFLGEGNYRAWYRRDNVTGLTRGAYGVSFDQRLTSNIGSFARFGSADAESGHDRFYSAGLQFQSDLALNPLDVWGLGYAHLDQADDAKERLVELFYNFHLSEKLHITTHVQYVRELRPGAPTEAFIVPGIRLQAGL